MTMDIGAGLVARDAVAPRPSLRRMPTVTSVEDLRLSPTAALFQGREEIPVSMFITRYEHGQGPSLHRHPYAEVFVVQTGTATFTVGDEELVVEAGNLTIVPPETPHGFENRGTDVLRVLSVHPSPTVQQTDLE
jgi:mannose-6-phosphate isomerase-like protein (cupin superfamily)